MELIQRGCLRGEVAVLGLGGLGWGVWGYSCRRIHRKVIIRGGWRECVCVGGAVSACCLSLIGTSALETATDAEAQKGRWRPMVVGVDASVPGCCGGGLHHTSSHQCGFFFQVDSVAVQLQI